MKIRDLKNENENLNTNEDIMNKKGVLGVEWLTYSIIKKVFLVAALVGLILGFIVGSLT